VLPALHPNLQRINDEQQPMSMDVLPALHPICSGSQAIDLVDVDAATGGYVEVVASTARNFV
jgi:hypothetical protein